MDINEDMCKSLVRWLQKLVPNKSRNISEICDGVAIVEALVQIEPQYFGKLEAKIKKDAGANWRLRVSNLKKISEAVLEYYQDVLTLQVLDNGKPDVNKIGESNDPVQLGKLLRLILGCAINCERKQEYITLMMEMEETVQQNIMQAIQQLEEVTGGPGRTGLSLLILDSDARVAKLVTDLESSNETREALTMQNQQLEHQVQLLNEEKRNLELQLENLYKKSKSPDNRKQMELLKEELFKAEVMRDDFKAKLYEQEKQMIAYQEKIAELQIAASDSSRLKDEVDALSESAGKVNDLEQTVASYKKRLENYQDLKKQVQKLEEKNMEYLQKNMELEEELNKKNTWRTQCEAFKNQILELQQKLDEETQKSDKAQFNLENLEAKMKALQAERDRLLVDRDSLREENEELKLGSGKATTEAGAAVSQELTPADLKERLRFLERENKTLRGAQQELDTKQSTLEQALSRAEKLQQQNRTLNQNILKLEAQLEELRSPEAASSSNPNLTVKKLQEALVAKEHELQVFQTRYQRNVQKAKEVAAQLHGSDGTRTAAGTMSLTEENLITAAFYKLCGQLQRGAADERLAALAPQGTFLSRQRQPVPRKLPAKFTPSKSK